MKLCLVLLLCLATYGCAKNHIDTANTQSCEGLQCLSEEEKERVGYQCKSIIVTGSRLPVKQCSTASQRTAAKEAAKNMVDRMQRQGQSQEGQ